MGKINVNKIISENTSMVPENANAEIIRRIVSAQPDIFDKFDAPKYINKMYRSIVIDNIMKLFEEYKCSISRGTVEKTLGKRNIFQYSEFGDNLGRPSFGIFIDGSRIASFKNANNAISLTTKINDIANDYASVYGY